MAKPRRNGMRRSYLKAYASGNSKPKGYNVSRPMMQALGYTGRASQGMDILAFMGVDLNTIPNYPRVQALQRAERLDAICDGNFMQNHLVLYKKKYVEMRMIWGNKGGKAVLVEVSTHGLVRVSIEYRSTERAKYVAMQGKILWDEVFMVNQ